MYIQEPLDRRGRWCGTQAELVWRYSTSNRLRKEKERATGRKGLVHLGLLHGDHDDGTHSRLSEIRKALVISLLHGGPPDGGVCIGI